MKKDRIPERITRVLAWSVTATGVLFAGLCVLLVATLGETSLLVGAVFGLASAAYGFEVARRRVEEPPLIRQPARLAA